MRSGLLSFAIAALHHPRPSLAAFQVVKNHSSLAALLKLPNQQQQQRTSSSATTPMTAVAGVSSSPHNASSEEEDEVDPVYPGTAVARMRNARARVVQLEEDGSLRGGHSWEHVRRRLLWAGGLRDLPDAVPGQGYTGHSFNDYNHVDLTCIRDNDADNEHDGTSVPGIARGNRLGPGIRIASLPDLGPGGSWTTCALGCRENPPRDVAHVQFLARIAFKLVWIPTPKWDEFVLVDDAGVLLAHGRDLQPPLTPLRERQTNYRLVEGSKYAREADRLANLARTATE